MWPFKRKPKQPVDRRDNSEDWQVGDVAECTKDDWVVDYVSAPRTGDVLRITAVEDAVGTFAPVRCYFLFFGAYADCGYESANFRKLRPADDGFVERIRRRRPVLRGREPA